MRWWERERRKTKNFVQFFSPCIFRIQVFMMMMTRLMDISPISWSNSLYSVIWFEFENLFPELPTHTEVNDNLSSFVVVMSQKLESLFTEIHLICCCWLFWTEISCRFQFIKHRFAKKKKYYSHQLCNLIIFMFLRARWCVAGFEGDCCCHSIKFKLPSRWAEIQILLIIFRLTTNFPIHQLKLI